MPKIFRFRPRLLWLLASVPLLALLSCAAQAQGLDYPLAIAVRDQTLYVADRELPGVWKIDDGKLSIFFRGKKQLRTPLNAPRSLAIDAEGRLLVGDSATREVYRFNAEGVPEPLLQGAGGGIGIPMGIAVLRSGDLLVSDLEAAGKAAGAATTRASCIWKVPAAGGAAERYAEVPAPAGICLDADERLWVVTRHDDQLVRISPDKKIEVLVKNRVFKFPHDVVIGPDGTAYVSDGYEQAIWKVAKDGKATKWVAGEPLVNPVGLAWRGDTLLVADPRAKAVFQIDPQGKISPLALTTE